MIPMLSALFSFWACTVSEKGTGEELRTSDFDGDGFSAADGDCDDTDNSVYPGAQDQWYDGIDSDCSGNDDYDQDGDGFAASGTEGSSLAGGDCWDDPTETPPEFIVLSGFIQPTAKDVNPSNPEVYYDGIDGDCADHELEFDQDEDGENSAHHADRNGAFGADCIDSTEAAIAAGIENFSAEEINSQATETYYDGIDQDCDGLSDFDQDGDGDDSADYGGSDCNDSNAEINSYAVELANDGIDQNCDGLELCYADVDNDGFGVDSLVETDDFDCWSFGIADNILDCQDSDPYIHPGATETIDNIDENCDGMEAAGFQACTGNAFYNDSWEYVYFLVCQATLSQPQALQTCQDYGYELASIYDQSENDELSSASSSISDIWISLNDQAQEGHFVWGDGFSPSYTSWLGGTPPETNTDENCVVLDGAGYWQAQNCSQGRYFACENRD